MDADAADSVGLGGSAATPPRGVQVWAVLKEIGVNGMRACVARHLDHARRVADRARASECLELLDEPTVSICCFRHVRPELDDRQLDVLNDEIVRGLDRHGRWVPSATRVRGKFAIRPCYINPRTTQAEVDGLVD